MLHACQSAADTNTRTFAQQTRHRARDKLVDASLEKNASAAVTFRHTKHRRQRQHVRSGAQHPTKLWMCDHGCCSIRWKLDYAEFQSYTIYAQVSPYVVVQDKTGQCTCVICRGLSDASSESETPAVLRKACTSFRIDASALTERLSTTAQAGASEVATSTTSASRRLSDSSATDDDDDDDGSI